MSKIKNKPSVFPLISDWIILTLSISVTMGFAPLATKIPFQKYFDINLMYGIIWVIISQLNGRYNRLRDQNFTIASRKLIKTSLFVLFLVGVFFFSPLNTSYSIWVIITYTLLNFLFTTVLYIIAFAIGNAIEYAEPEVVIPKKNFETENKSTSVPLKLDDDSFENLKSSIIEVSGKAVYNFFSRYIDFSLSSSLAYFTYDYFDLKSRSEKRYNAVAVLKSLNQIRGINKLFSLMNQKLPLDGLMICNFEQSNTHKMKIFRKYPPFISHMIYFFDYLFRRVIPKLNLTTKFYYNITKGKDRVLSKTEVLGRLVYCGFEIVQVKKINQMTYVVVRKNKVVPVILESKRYGPFIVLKRVGRNGRMIHVYKMRTMFAYSEYLQAYIFSQNSLRQGGKIYKDTRTNFLGKIMRKYWLDELPMLINLAKGEMKIVGVRPLSQHYYSLYSPELQRKRIRHKPGLLPPFYADMPNTLQEIEASELKYLRACETKGVFKTDVIYFLKIARNILFRKARSA